MDIISEFTQRCPESPWTVARALIAANDGALHVADKLGLLPTSGSIDVVASTNNYDLVSNFSTFLKLDIGGGGVQYYDGTDYKPLKIVSERWLETYIPGWRNSNEDEPMACWRKGKDLWVYPTPSTSVTSGLKVYYYAKPAAMTADGDDPFDHPTDGRGELENLHEGVVLYMLWKAKQALGEYGQSEIHRGELARFFEEKKWAVYDDQMADNEPFRPYHQGPVYNPADPSQWGIT